MAVDVELHDHTLLVTLNRPEAGNALDPDTGRGLVAAFARAAEDDVRAVVVTGAGEKIFCAGMDLKAFAAGVDTAPIGAGINAMRTSEKPVIAAVNGVAFAGGFEVTTALATRSSCAAPWRRFSPAPMRKRVRRRSRRSARPCGRGADAPRDRRQAACLIGHRRRVRPVSADAPGLRRPSRSDSIAATASPRADGGSSA